MRAYLSVSLAVCGLLLFSAIAPSTAFPCTTFCLEDGKGAVIGKSYDWDFGDARLFVNKSGVSKKALILNGEPAVWTSRFASLTFNQFGREFPNGGINEAGLVIEVMMLSESVYPPADQRKAINELQWIQYQLDQYQNVTEVMAHVDEVRIAPISSTGKLHYMICDRSGACATLEFVEGKLMKTTANDLIVPVLTNDTYAHSREHLQGYKGFGGNQPVPSDSSSLSRFVIAAQATRLRIHDPVQAAFTTLDRVRQSDYTKWNIVYDTREMRVHFKSFGHDAVKVVDLSRLFSTEQRTCKLPVKSIDMNIDVSGDVTNRFSDYKAADNLSLVKRTLSKLDNFPAPLIAMAAAYPDSLPCTLK